METLNNQQYRVRWTKSDDAGSSGGDLTISLSEIRHDFSGLTFYDEDVTLELLDQSGECFARLATDMEAITGEKVTVSISCSVAGMTDTCIQARLSRTPDQVDWILPVSCPGGAENFLSGASLDFNLVPAIYNNYMPGRQKVLCFQNSRDRQGNVPAYVHVDSLVGFDNFNATINGFRISGWIRADSPGCVFSLLNDAGESVFSVYIGNDARLGVTIREQCCAMSQGSSLLDGGWHLFGVTGDSTTLQFYIDNQLCHSMDSPDLLESGIVSQMLIGLGTLADQEGQSAYPALPMNGQFLGHMAGLNITTQSTAAVPLSSLVMKGYSKPASYDFTRATYKDLSGNGNDGIPCSVEFVDDQVQLLSPSRFLRLRGFDNSVCFDWDNPEEPYCFETGPMTIEAWFRTSSGGGILASGAAASGGHYTSGYALGVNPDGSLSMVAGGQLLLQADTGNAATDGRWHHVAVVRNSDNCWKLLFDGRTIGSFQEPSPLNLLAKNMPLELGRQHQPSPQDISLGFDSSAPPEAGGLPEITLAEVRLWHAERSDSQLFQSMCQQLYADALLNDAQSLSFYLSLHQACLVDSSPVRNLVVNAGEYEIAGTTGLSLSPPQWISREGFSVPGISQYAIGNGDWTAEMWIRPVSLDCPLFCFPVLTDPSNALIFLRLYETDREVNFKLSTVCWPADEEKQANAVTSDAVSVSAESWYHVALVSAQGNYLLYLNGEILPLADSGTEADDLSYCSELSFGRTESNEYEAEMDIAEVRLWNCARPVADIRAAMRIRMSGAEADLAGLWGFYYGVCMDSTLLQNHGGQSQFSCYNVCDVPASLPVAALSFDGVSAYAALGQPEKLNFPGAEPYSMAGWIKLRALPSAGMFQIFSKWNQGEVAQYSLCIDNGRLAAGRGVTPWWLQGNTRLQSDIWYHVAMTYDGVSLTLYLNGSMEASQDFAAVPDAAIDVLMGAFLNDGICTDLLNGEIASFMVFNEALSSNQIWRMAGGELDETPPAPVAAWNFNNASLQDVSVTAEPADAVLHNTAALVPADEPRMKLADVLAFQGAGAYLQCAEADGQLKPVGSFSLECWVRGGQPGEASEALIMGFSGMCLRRTDNSGGIDFYTAGLSSASTQSKSVNINNGSWHHLAAVYDQDKGIKTLYVNGCQQQQDKAVSGVLELEDDDVFCIGGDGSANGFCLAMTEVRVWNRALNLQDDILPHMNRKLVGFEAGLLAYWKCTSLAAQETDLTNHGYNGSYQNDVTSVQSPLHLLPPQPFIAARSKLIQDWTAEDEASGNMEGRTVYQTVATVYSGNGIAMGGEAVTVWSELPLVLESGGRRYAVDSDSSVRLIADVNGQITLTAAADSIGTSALKFWAPFMKSDDRIVICPDDYVLDKAAALSGDYLQSSPECNSQPPLLGDQYSTDEADAVANSINSTLATIMMNNASEAFRSRPRYTGSMTGDWRPDSVPDVASENYTLDDDRVFRRPVRSSPTASFRLTFTGADQGYKTPQAGAKRRKCIVYHRLERDDLRSLFSCADSKPVSLHRSYSLSAVWNSFVSGAEKMESVVVAAASDLGHDFAGAEHAVVAVIQQLDQELCDATQVLIEDVSKVGDTVVGILQQVLNAAEEELQDFTSRIVSFFRNEFAWDDVLISKRAISHMVNQWPTAMIEINSSVTGYFDELFDEVKLNVSSMIELLEKDIGSMSLRQLGALSSDPSGLKSHLQQTWSAGAGSVQQAGVRQADDGLPGNFNVAALMKDFKVESVYLFSKLSEAMDEDIKSPDYTDLGPDVAAMAADYLQQLIVQLEGQGTEVIDAFTKAYDYFSQLASHPESMPQLALAGFLEILEAGSKIAFDLLQDGMDVMIDLVNLMLASIQTLWNEPIYIPVVSWLYEHVVTEGDKLTLLDFCALTTAVPTTLISKFVTGNPPLTESELLELETQSFVVPEFPGVDALKKQQRFPTAEELEKALSVVHDSGLLLRVAEYLQRQPQGMIFMERDGKSALVPGPWRRDSEFKWSTNEKLTLLWQVVFDVTLSFWSFLDVGVDTLKLVSQGSLQGNEKLKMVNTVGMGVNLLIPIICQAATFPPGGLGTRYKQSITGPQWLGLLFWVYRSEFIIFKELNFVSMQIAMPFIQALGKWADNRWPLNEKLVDTGSSLINGLKSLNKFLMPIFSTIYGVGWEIIVITQFLYSELDLLLKYADVDGSTEAGRKKQDELLEAMLDDLILFGQNFFRGLPLTGKILGTDWVSALTEETSIPLYLALDVTGDTLGLGLACLRTAVLYDDAGIVQIE